MMMKILFFVISQCIFTVIEAQDTGIIFEQNKNWKAVLALAKAENKYVFVDCFTTWCGPCQAMTKNIFPIKEVGNFFNARFINVKFQFDSTLHDLEGIKREYQDAAFIKSEYQVNGYPTYLFFNPSGELVHRELGACNANEFIARGTNALDTQKQYYTQIKKYETGYRDPTFLKNLTLLAVHAMDESAMSKYAKDYFSTNPDLLSNDNLQFIYLTTLNVRDTGFGLIVNNLSKFDSVVNKKELRSFLNFVIKRSEFFQNNNEYRNWDNNKWNTYENLLHKKYPLFAEDVLVQIKTIIFQDKNDWKSYAKVVEKYAATLSPFIDELNEYAWALFTKCNDRKILKIALKWSKKSFTNQAKIEPGYIDTYANLLYKIGRKKDALKWEMKGQRIAIEQGLDKNWGQDVIDKISNGEKTW